MRLCYIANPNSIHAHRYLQYFSSAGHEVILLAHHPPQQPFPADVTLYDLTAQTNLRKFRFVVWALSVRRILRQIKPDLLHAQGVANAGWLAAASGFHPFIVTAWGSDLLVGPRRSSPQRWLARWVLGQADYVTCVSENLAQAAQALGADPSRLEVAPFGVDTTIFHPAPDRSALRAKLGLGQGPLVLSLRAMRPIYNPLDIARAIPLVLNQVPQSRFIIRVYGQDPALLAEFKAIVQEHQSEDHVHYVGEQKSDEAIADINRAVDVVVSVPDSDGTPLSVLEAMACGGAAVLSDLPSLREWVQDGREGLFIPVGDYSALSQAIVRLLQNTTLRQQIQTNAQELVHQRANSQLWMARAEEMYQQLVPGSD